MTLGVSAVVAVGVLGGVALAAGPGRGGDGERPGITNDAGPRHHRHALRLTLKSIMETCGLTREDLRTGFQAGQSINQIIEAKGGDPAACQAAVLAKLEERLAAAVAEGKLSAERAAEILAGASEKLARLMAHVPTPRGDAS